MSKNKVTDVMTLTPSKTVHAMNAMMNTNPKRALFIWGPPGISKSDSAKQVATKHKVAFVDVRLSQIDPTDLRGIPMPVTEGGVHGVRWSAPLVLPRDIDFNQVVETVAGEPSNVRFYNPMGKNNIPYCTNPNITAESLTVGLVSVVVSSGNNNVVVGLVEKGSYETAVNLVTNYNNGSISRAEYHDQAVGLFKEGRVNVQVTGQVKALVALEEFNSAPPSVQAAAYELILDRRLGEYKVPDDVYLMGMGNRETDQGVTYKMPSPVMNRFVHVEMSPDFDDWQRWAINSAVHPDVVGFLTAFPAKLIDGLGDLRSASRGFATPRSWEFVSDIIKNADPDCPNEVMTNLFVGAVGQGIGVEFNAFRKEAMSLPSPKEVLSGEVIKLREKATPGMAYALVTSLCYAIREEYDQLKSNHTNSGSNAQLKDTKEHAAWVERADRFFAFIMENFVPEICVFGARIFLKEYKITIPVGGDGKTPNFKRFTKDYADLIVG